MVSVGFKTDKGMLRGGNEDSLFVLPEQQLYIVADGVGGHNSGELASRLTVGFIAQYVAINKISNIRNERELKRYFKTCLHGANELVRSKAEGDNVGMATTVVLCYLRDGKAYVVNVGDSRAYLMRDGVLRQISEDHTYVNEMVQRGVMTQKEADDSPNRNMITRAIGAEDDIKPDFFNFNTYPGDIIILCTDGLYGEAEDDTIQLIASQSTTMHQLANDLVSTANSNGGHDNVSVVCIKIQ